MDVIKCGALIVILDFVGKQDKSLNQIECITPIFLNGYNKIVIEHENSTKM